MNILITGAKGYIGTALMKELGQRYNVTGISREDFDLTNSVDTANWFKDKQFDVVIHAAGVGVRNTQKTDIAVLDANLKMYYNLLEASAQYDRFINIGSGAELLQQDTSYGMSKHIIRSSILGKDKFYNLRVYGLFDENELNSRFIKANLINYIRKHDMIIHQNRYMDFLYMKDFCKIVEYYLTHSTLPKEYDCCYRNGESLLGIVEYINTLSDYTVNVVFITSRHNLGVKYASNDRQLQVLGDYYMTGLYDGIKEVYDKLLTIETV